MWTTCGARGEERALSVAPSVFSIGAAWELQGTAALLALRESRLSKSSAGTRENGGIN